MGTEFQPEFQPEVLAALDRFRQEVEAALDDYSQGLDGCPEHLIDAMRYSLLAPGKRIRPLFALLACELCGGTWSTAIPAACAVEMIHAYSLIHDDLPAMDDDDLRRGRPTSHIKFGEATAILAGDALQALAFRTVVNDIARGSANDAADPALAGRCVALLADAAGPTGMVGGQADDTHHGEEPSSVDPRSRLLSIHRRKTGALLGVALELGGLVAGAAADEIKSLTAYGRHFGLAFQITDDLLDYLGDAENMGKRVRKDAGKNKLTYPGVFGLDAAWSDAAEEVRAACLALEPFKPTDQTPRNVRIAYDSLIAYARYLLGRKQ